MSLIRSRGISLPCLATTPERYTRRSVVTTKLVVVHRRKRITNHTTATADTSSSTYNTAVLSMATFTATVTATASTKAAPGLNNVDQCGRRSRTTCSLSFSSFDGNGMTSVSRNFPEPAVDLHTSV